MNPDKHQQPSLKDHHSSFFELEANDIEGNQIPFSIYRDKKAILIVNVASKCGLTSKNYTSLTKMYNELKGKGLEILAFPCNQFGSQQSGTNQQICQFAREVYQASFPLFQKVEVNGEKAHPVFRFLVLNSPLYDSKKNTIQDIPWNFAKFLVNSQGQVVKYFTPFQDLGVVQKQIEKLL